MLRTLLKAWPELLMYFVYSLPAWRLSLLPADPVASSDGPSRGGEPLAGPHLACALQLGVLNATAWLQVSRRALS